MLSSCERSVEEWRADLEEGNSFEREMAAIAFREVSDEQLPQYLVRLAATSFDHDDRVRRAARESLLFLREGGRLVPAVAGNLVAGLKNADPRRRVVSALVLAYFDEADEAMLAALTTAAGDSHASVRFHALEALQALGGEEPAE